MAADTQAQTWVAFAGEDIAIVLTGEDNTNPSAYAMAFTVARFPISQGGSALVTVTQASMTIAGSGPYTISIPITRLQSGTTLGAGEWVADLWRTDSGSNKRLAGGKLQLIPPVRAVA
jgi:hypothetical protein